MARVTVEDCVEKEPNRFDLVMIAAQRARDISAGSALTVDRDNDKNPVVALREIADSTVELDDLREGLVKIHQKHVEADEAEEEIIELMAGEEDWLSKGLMPEDAAETPEEEDLGATVEGASGEAVDEGDGSREGQGADLGAGIDPDKMDELAREVEAALDIETGVAAADEGPADEGSADEGPTDEGPADDGAAGEGADDENR